MLANPVFEVYSEERLAQVIEMIREYVPDYEWGGPGSDVENPRVGVVIGGGFNLDNNITNFAPATRYGFWVDLVNGDVSAKLDREWIWDDRRSEVVTGCYGVCDNADQVLARYAALIARPDVKVCVHLQPVYKADQPAHDGWRWEKWGEYIGRHEPEYEYLADERDIDVVYVYNVWILE